MNLFSFFSFVGFVTVIGQAVTAEDRNSLKRREKQSDSAFSFCAGSRLCQMATVAAGAGAAVAAFPVVLGTMGFTATGIAAGSLASSMMSAAAVANGGGVVAGSAVAIGQSIGAAGLSTAATAVVGSVGAAVGGILGSSGSEQDNEE